MIIDDGIREAYETGRGAVRIRARVEVEQRTARSQGIVVTELPYMVGPEKVVNRVNELVANDKLAGRRRRQEPLRPHDRPADPDRLQARRQPRGGARPSCTARRPLEETFGINNVVLVERRPPDARACTTCAGTTSTTGSTSWCAARSYRLERARARLHIVEGLVIALDNIDLVVAIIRGSADVAEARERLCAELALSEIQATHILDMQLRRLTALEMQKIIDERDELLAGIDELREAVRFRATPTHARPQRARELVERLRPRASHADRRRPTSSRSTTTSRSRRPPPLHRRPTSRASSPCPHRASSVARPPRGPDGPTPGATTCWSRCRCLHCSPGRRSDVARVGWLSSRPTSSARSTVAAAASTATQVFGINRGEAAPDRGRRGQRREPRGRHEQWRGQTAHPRRIVRAPGRARRSSRCKTTMLSSVPSPAPTAPTSSWSPPTPRCCAPRRRASACRVAEPAVSPV